MSDAQQNGFPIGAYVIEFTYEAHGSMTGAESAAVWTMDADVARRFVNSAFENGIAMQDHPDARVTDGVATFQDQTLLHVITHVRVPHWPEVDDWFDGARELTDDVMSRYMPW